MEVINHIAAVMITVSAVLISSIMIKLILIVLQISDRCAIDPCDSYSNVDYRNL